MSCTRQRQHSDKHYTASVAIRSHCSSHQPVNELLRLYPVPPQVHDLVEKLELELLRLHPVRISMHMEIKHNRGMIKCHTDNDNECYRKLISKPSPSMLTNG